ncbi:uncharacterized protein I303_105393 [Kwoniella dejecticola CBS 10117]|uniref:Uncharacterized protein n=1 Tax=Kwoniella dejecticola CBS 10117 TaxID=1296121 RepID=A0A1A6A2M9_9TREE|nr:uncharacterized protein I303_05162 [Kwoniella dejecticola CBS 10117]OBR84304.1 hypothetical protein I303_05162 [Kwoniella dejecticola CBS 10117]
MASLTYQHARPLPSSSPFISTSSSGHASSRLTTPLAPPPPPPLYMSAHDHASGPERQVRYAGADHTLGPSFSEEEDGDDTAFIAAKMAALGLDPSGRPYNQTGFTHHVPTQPRNNRSRTPLAPTHLQNQIQAQAQAQRQAQMAYLTQQAQQQQALFHLLSQQTQTQPQPYAQPYNQHPNQNNSNPQMREAMALLELQQIQQSATDRHAYVMQQAQRAHHQAGKQVNREQANFFERQQNQQQQQQEQQQQQQEQQQQQQIREMQYLQDLHLQQQLAALQSQNQAQAQAQAQAQNEYQARSASGHGLSRTALSAQIQARTAGRVAQARGISMSLEDTELRARFESVSVSNTSSEASHVKPEQRYEDPATSPSRSPVFTTGGHLDESPTSPSNSWRSSGSPSPTKTTILTPTEISTPVQVSSVRSPKGGRFSQARQAMEAEGTEKPYGTLTATLSGRSLTSSTFEPLYTQTQTQTQMQPIFGEPKTTSKEEVTSNSPTVERKTLKYTLGALGYGKPSTVSATTVRSTTVPNPPCTQAEPALAQNQQQQQRAVTQPAIPQVKIIVVRQPHGPPCEASELGDKNFQSRIRRQAGLNLTMLGRRTESPCPTPVLA